MQVSCNYDATHQRSVKKYMLNTDTDGQGEMVAISNRNLYIYKIVIFYSNKKLMSECIRDHEGYKFKSLKSVSLDEVVEQIYDTKSSSDTVKQIRKNIIQTIERGEKSYLDSGVPTIDCEDIWTR